MNYFVYSIMFAAMAIAMIATTYYGYVAYKNREYFFAFVFFFLGCVNLGWLIGENQYGILLLVLFIISLLWVLSDALQDYVQSYIKK